MTGKLSAAAQDIVAQAVQLSPGDEHNRELYVLALIAERLRELTEAVRGVEDRLASR